MPKQTLGQELIEAMKEVVAHHKGAKMLRERIVKVASKSAKSAK